MFIACKLAPSSGLLFADQANGFQRSVKGLKQHRSNQPQTADRPSIQVVIGLVAATK